MPFPYPKIIMSASERCNYCPINCRETALPCPDGLTSTFEIMELDLRLFLLNLKSPIPNRQLDCYLSEIASCETIWCNTVQLRQQLITTSHTNQSLIVARSNTELIETQTGSQPN
jgi:hypothetical protein